MICLRVINQEPIFVEPRKTEMIRVDNEAKMKIDIKWNWVIQEHCKGTVSKVSNTAPVMCNHDVWILCCQCQRNSETGCWLRSGSAFMLGMWFPQQPALVPLCMTTCIQAYPFFLLSDFNWIGYLVFVPKSGLTVFPLPSNECCVFTAFDLGLQL